MSIRSPFFLGWDQPWLPRLAELLLEKTADLSDDVIILPGRRAGRRLLELLALQAQEQSQLLLPPIITTLEDAAFKLLEVPNALPIAGASMTRLAWRQASLQLTSEEIQAIQLSPEKIISPATRDRVAALAEGLALELGKAGLSITELLAKHAPFFPESADREEPRWEALAHLQKEYRKTLSHWGYSDPADALKQKLQQGTYREKKSIVVAGVVDFLPLLVSFFEKVAPNIIIIAPEAHAEGFDRYGKILPSYWLEHPADVPEKILIPCERSRDQAIRTWEIFDAWKKETSATAIVAPDPDSISLLRETGSAMGFTTRWAGGDFFQGSSLFVLLKALQKFLNRPLGKPPSLAAVAELLRHPITALSLSSSLKIPSELLLRELDDWEREHLSLVLEESHLKQFHKEETLVALLNELEKNFTFGLNKEPLEKILHQFRRLLLHLLEQKKVHRSDPEGHFFLECFEKLLLVLEELETLSISAKLYWSGGELLSFLLEMLSKERIPELEQPQAVEIIGWLEATAEDIPSLLLTSFHEGAIPATPKNDPLLSERLRKTIGLESSREQLARAHYQLHLILSARQQKGGIAILAPRYNGRGEPVRPSRLLLQGCTEEQLPERILSLTQRHAFVEPLVGPTKQQNHHSFFHARPIEPVKIERLNVTTLKTYLTSPRLFYLQHVLKLREVLDAPVEMTPRQFGVLLHRILGSFSSELTLQEEKASSVFIAWLEKALESSFQWQFGKNPPSAVTSQKSELLRSLKGFAQAEAAHRAEGWKTVIAEGKKGSSLLEQKLILDDGRSLFLQGRIDRLDWHPEKKRWLLLDYKTSHHQEWKKETPNRMHFLQRGETVIWHDLQLPLYLKLAGELEAIKNSQLPLPTIDNTDLCYFQLPIHPEAAGISEPFEQTMIEPAWKEALRLVDLILNGSFEEVGTLGSALSPTWSALCGI